MPTMRVKDETTDAASLLGEDAVDLHLRVAAVNGAHKIVERERTDPVNDAVEILDNFHGELLAQHLRAIGARRRRHIYSIPVRLTVDADQALPFEHLRVSVRRLVKRSIIICYEVVERRCAALAGRAVLRNKEQRLMELHRL